MLTDTMQLSHASRIARSFLAVLAVLFIGGCGNGEDSKGPTDTPNSGAITVSADETYRPVIEQQIKVFDSSFPQARITVRYRTEAECFQDFLDGTSRLILVTRKPLPAELKAYEARKIVPHSVAIARDAVAVVLHPSSPDTVLSLEQLEGILTGQYARKYTVVFDRQGSSSVRFITDSLIPGRTLGANVFAAQGADSVVAYVSKNKDAIGFIGLSYVADPADVKTGSFRTDVQVASVQSRDTSRAFVQPYQAWVAMRRYPLTRDLYYIHGETQPRLGTGFARFLAGRQGQLIFQRAFLFPLKMNIVIRQAEINGGPAPVGE